MTILTRPILEINLANLLENYKMLEKLADKSTPAAVVKDDAYGLNAEIVAKTLYEKANCRNFFTAHAVEAEKIAPNLKNARIFSGQLSLTETAALISKCDLFISGDSGPLHLADAVGARTIALMGSTHPRSSSAYSKNGTFIEPTISCRYCGQRKCKMLSEGEKFTPCMASVKPQMVMDVIEKNACFN